MKLLTTLFALTSLVVPSVAQAQLQSSRFDHYPTGPHTYDLPDRNPVASLSFMEQRRQEDVRAESPFFPGLGNGGTVAVGNWQQYYLTVGDGSHASIHNVSPQADWGTQTAVSNVNSQNSAGDQTVRNGSSWRGGNTACSQCADPPSWDWGR